jgi:D-xylulose reductase
MFCNKEITAKGSFRYQAGDYDLAVGLLANKKVSVKELITGIYAFNDAESAFEASAAGKGIKTVISGVGI